MTAFPKFVLLDRALPLSESALAGADHLGMTDAERLATALITELEGEGNAAAIAHVRAALALTRPGADDGRPARVGFVKQAALNDCYSACVATLLGLDLGDVPKFFPDAVAALPPGEKRVPKVYDAIREWAWARGLAPLILLTRADLPYLLHHAERLNPGIPYILGGTSKWGTGHAVVVCHGRIIHEPMPGYGPEDGGVVAPGDDGQFDVTYFVTLPTWASATPPAPMDIAPVAEPA